MVFELQYTTGAYTDVPECAWKNGPRFETLEEAGVALQKEFEAMRERCGPASWDSNYRITTDKDTIIEVTWVCPGPLDSYCEDHAEETVEVPWRAWSRMPTAPYPEGWHNGLCPSCAAKQAEKHWDTEFGS